MILEGATTDFLNGTGTIDPATTETVDSIVLAQTKYVKWFVYIEGENKSQAFEVLAVERDSVATYTIYALVGDFVNYSRDITSDGSTMDFTITNNEITEITVKIKRLITN